ncbi:MAG: LLM class F420-dependent oxidoreductase [Deltaproteobacteria bacterium]|nr:LLM class F420-dependent oxidoreductase [Deltaproteobacteria bacterium]
MKLATSALSFGPKIKIKLDLILHAEKLGFDSTWTAEAYGNDAVTTATWIAAKTTTLNVGTAIMQMPARTPAMTAMTATTLNQLSEGRFKLGLGPSGPQVVEGWHGVPYGKPLARTKEYIEIIRLIWEREEPLEYHGMHYDIPCKGEGTTGLGKPLKSILRGDSSIPIYTASISPNGLRCAAEVADGVIPIMFDPERYDDLLKPHLEEGFAKAGGDSGKKKGLADFDVMTSCTVVISDDLEKAMVPVKAHLAQYIGGMGARNKNFYNDYAKRMGFEAAAVEIQDLFLDGKRTEAVAAVPDELVDAVHLVGSEGKIRDRLQAWKEAGRRGEVGTMLLGATQPEALELVAEELL